MTFTVESNEVSDVTIEIRNIYGRVLYSTLANVKPESKTTLTWDGTRTLSNGLYFVSFKTSLETVVKKVIVK